MRPGPLAVRSGATAAVTATAAGDGRRGRGRRRRSRGRGRGHRGRGRATAAGAGERRTVRTGTGAPGRPRLPLGDGMHGSVSVGPDGPLLGGRMPPHARNAGTWRTGR
ncbi:hypothetical protein E3E14_14145 [Streptomyces sp. ICN441]|nr:hypothetical protein E3E14_14145 [Streptomyces sp. ICN441]